ncbi:conserved hypothetical protein [Candidatus Terasakiella magnetica]|uniref:Sulfur carrier protein FdhD n=1 Tax=Candidatus Terasakiella magnetica TaxID=1867952 RepID=A0A1C3RHU9_9PROT|nr:formate dehydrogenase accessory sulfurtransferase FdhD [Candidatus Terasakiella magnetica]SCA56850.1 conserved hypothetical protein [Candidatus Terasakiella magnetica]
MSDDYIIKPQPETGTSTSPMKAVDAHGNPVELDIVHERPLTVFLNNREIVTLMSIGDHPKLLGVGYLVNQNMLSPQDQIESIDYDDVIDTVVIRTKVVTDFEEKLKRKILTSGCGQGTIFADIMDKLEDTTLAQTFQFKASWLELLLNKIKATPSLYRKAGSIHGCVLCHKDKPLIYMEDVGRHNALDKIAGYLYLNDLPKEDYILYTTGRMTSEMVMKAVIMGIEILISRSGATQWAVELAEKTGLTLISRARPKRFIALCHQGRIMFDLEKPSSKAAE